MALVLGFAIASAAFPARVVDEPKTDDRKESSEKENSKRALIVAGLTRFDPRIGGTLKLLNAAVGILDGRGERSDAFRSGVDFVRTIGSEIRGRRYKFGIKFRQGHRTKTDDKNEESRHKDDERNESLNAVDFFQKERLVMKI